MGHRLVENEIEALLKKECLGVQYLCHNAAVRHVVSQVFAVKDLPVIHHTIQKQLIRFACVSVPLDLCPWVHLLETEVELLNKQENEAHKFELMAWQNRGLTGALAYAFEGKPLGVFDEEIYKKYYALSTEIKKRFLSNVLLQYRLTTREF